MPRPHDTDPGPGADCQLIGYASALAQNAHQSAAAYFVALGVTPELEGFCTSLLRQQADYGHLLKTPIDAVFRHINTRNLSAPASCSYQPRWLSTQR